MVANTNYDSSELLSQISLLNKYILKLNIERLEDEILAFEDTLRNAVSNPVLQEKIPLEIIKNKITKLHLLEERLMKE